MNKIRDYWFATDDLPKRIPHNQMNIIKEWGPICSDFPNNEVRKGFLSILATNYMKPKSKEVTS